MFSFILKYECFKIDVLLNLECVCKFTGLYLGLWFLSGMLRIGEGGVRD